MGYSIFTIAKSKKESKRMFDFMSTNMKSFNKEVLGEEGDYIALTDDLAYTAFPKKVMKNAIGFDYNSSANERFYAYQLMKWIAVKIGGGVYYYDCEKKKNKASIMSVSEVIEDMAKRNKEAFDKSGNIKPLEHFINSTRFMQFGFWMVETGRDKKAEEFIDGEIKRLDNLWEQL